MDKLFYDGLSLSYPICIQIKGNEDTEKTLLGLQLLYGLGESLSIALNQKIEPLYHSTYLSQKYLNDLLLDTLIASYIQKMTRKSVRGESSSLMSNIITKSLFNTDEIICKDNNDNIYQQLPISKIENHSDELICQEAIYYNNRTNSLHFRTMGAQSSEKNVLYERKHNEVVGYLKDFSNTALDTILGGKLINIKISTHQDNKDINNWGAELPIMTTNNQKQLIAIDTSNSNPEQLTQIIKLMKENANVFILITNNNIEIPEYLADIIINLKTKSTNGYLLQYLSITKSRNQSSTLGWHQYKRRDYGIEIYPSLHTYFQQRRYLQRALVYTHSNVLTDTYQQYLDKNEFKGNHSANYTEYEQEIKKSPERYFKALCPTEYLSFTSIDILEKILLNQRKSCCSDITDRMIEADQEQEFMYGNHGGVTAIIGKPNTYKRFLTFGSSFSSALNEEHTLILLLNKEDSVIRRRLLCPARSNKPNSLECMHCYSYIHFMNIYMGCITPEELIYFIERQIEVTYPGNKPIKRIIIDDLQIVDFCFPLLKKDTLFLSALLSIFRERGISLYVLCDKSGSLVESLRTLSDNVICTDRDNNGKLLLYVERFAGYNNTPSKIYCGKIESVKKLFECFEKYEENHATLNFTLDNTQIKDHSITSMNEYWINK